jgi:hypothetical protein
LHNKQKERNNMGVKVHIDATSGKDFEVVEDLIQGGILADIVDKGMVVNKYKKPGPDGKQPLVHKCYFMWIVSELDSDDRNKRVFESFTVSLGPKATLRKRYKELTGKTDEEVDALTGDLDLDVLLGSKRTLVLSKEDPQEKGGKPFLKVQSTMKLRPGMTAPEIPADFKRKDAAQG